MGIFEFLKKKNEQKQSLNYMQMLSSNYPVFSQFGNDIYASDVVQQAIYKVVTEMKKLRPKHIRREGTDSISVNDSIQRVLDQPNEIMTRSDFLEKVTWQVMLNYNCFIYKERNREGKLEGLYPLNPTQVTFLEAPNRTYIKLQFRDNTTYTLPYDSFIHIKTHYSVNDVMGGNSQGQPDNNAILRTLDLNDTLLQGVRKALQSSFQINGIVKYNTLLDDGKVEAEIKEFERKLANSQSGILGIDSKADVVQFNRNIQLIDEATLKFVDDKILRNFGVPIEIVRGSFTTEQYQAFYQTTLEPLIINYSEAFTKQLFTSKELGFGNEIIFYPKELVFMNSQQTLEMVNLFLQSGMIMANEARQAFGLEPLEELKGVRMQSLNYINTKIAEQYQLDSLNVKGEENEQ